MQVQITEHNHQANVWLASQLLTINTIWHTQEMLQIPLLLLTVFHFNEKSLRYYYIL